MLFFFGATLQPFPCSVALGTRVTLMSLALQRTRHGF